MDNRDTPSLRDLVTILYTPRETMRRILDRRDRWTIQLVILAFICAAVNDSEARGLARVLPDLNTATAALLIFLAMVAGALLWVLFLFIFAGLATIVGRFLGGTTTAADVRAALAWALVPSVWSIVYRVPVALYESRLTVDADMSERELLLNLLSSGGFSIFAVAFGLEILIAIACMIIGSHTVGEALGVSTAKGFGTIAITVVTPIAIITAAAITHSLS